MHGASLTPTNPPRQDWAAELLDRFADPGVLVLSSLAGGDKHGYALIKDIEAFADVTLGPGTLYVSRQHDKRVAFAASGWTSMRAYLSVTQVKGALFLVPALAVVGAILGLVGATVFRPRTAHPKGMTAQPQ
jgi:hypothetical protein